MSPFEAGMLICFGAAWPFSIYRSYKTKVVAGKSLAFMVIVDIGYVCGMLHKVFYNFDGVFYLYLLNFVLVTVDMSLYMKYSKRRPRI
jgi:hypothetical protein